MDHLPTLIVHGNEALALAIAVLGFVSGMWGPQVWFRLRKRSSTKVTPSMRVVAGLCGIVSSCGLLHGAGTLALASCKPATDPDQAWSMAVFASATTARQEALAAAQSALTELLARELPEEPLRNFDRSKVGRLNETRLAQLLGLARFRNDCEESVDFLGSVAQVHNAAREQAVAVSLACGRPAMAARIAERRFQLGDFAGASDVYDQAALDWGVDDLPKTGARLIQARKALRWSRYKEELVAHHFANRSDAALRALARSGDESPTITCVVESLRVVAGAKITTETLARAASEPTCAATLAPLVPRSKRAPLLAGLSGSEHAATRINHDMLRAVTMDQVVDENLSWEDAVRLSPDPETVLKRMFRPESVNLRAAGTVFAMAERLNRITSPRPAVRFLRARVHIRLALVTMLAGDDARTRAMLAKAQEDQDELSRRAFPETYAHLRAREDSFYREIAQVFADLWAHDLDDARARASRLQRPEHMHEMRFQFEAETMLAERELIQSFVALLDGAPDRLHAFVASEPCRRFVGCAGLRQQLPTLLAAVTSDEKVDQSALLVNLALSYGPASKARRKRPELLEFVSATSVWGEAQPRVFTTAAALRLARVLNDTDTVSRLEPIRAHLFARILDPSWDGVLGYIERLHMAPHGASGE